LSYFRVSTSNRYSTYFTVSTSNRYSTYFTVSTSNRYSTYFTVSKYSEACKFQKLFYEILNTKKYMY
jgi:hypothetical protein